MPADDTLAEPDARPVGPRGAASSGGTTVDGSEFSKNARKARLSDWKQIFKADAFIAVQVSVTFRNAMRCQLSKSDTFTGSRLKLEAGRCFPV